MFYIFYQKSRHDTFHGFSIVLNQLATRNFDMHRADKSRKVIFPRLNKSSN